MASLILWKPGWLHVPHISHHTGLAVYLLMISIIKPVSPQLPVTVYGHRKSSFFQQDYKAFKCLCFLRHYHFINGHYANPFTLAFSVTHVQDHVTTR